MIRVIAALVALAVCGACDEKIEVRNQAPEARVVGLCPVGDRVYFVVDVFDREADPVDLALVLDGQRAAPGAAGDGLFGLASDRREPGARHWIEWDADPSACDRGFPELESASGCRVRPSPLPDSVSVRTIAGDRETQSTSSFDIVSGSGCDDL